MISFLKKIMQISIFLIILTVLYCLFLGFFFFPLYLCLNYAKSAVTRQDWPTIGPMRKSPSIVGSRAQNPWQAQIPITLRRGHLLILYLVLSKQILTSKLFGSFSKEYILI